MQSAKLVHVSVIIRESSSVDRVSPNHHYTTLCPGNLASKRLLVNVISSEVPLRCAVSRVMAAPRAPTRNESEVLTSWGGPWNNCGFASSPITHAKAGRGEKDQQESPHSSGFDRSKRVPCSDVDWPGIMTSSRKGESLSERITDR